jgi:hypothetical protein
MTTTSIDQTALILARYGTPAKRRDYALMNAKSAYELARQAAIGAYEAAGGNMDALRSPKDQRGERLYDALVSAIQDAAADYQERRGEIMADYQAEAAYEAAGVVLV